MANDKSFWSLKIGSSKSSKKTAGEFGEAQIASQSGKATSKKPRRSTKSTSIILGIFLIVVVAAAAVYYLVPRLTGGDSATVSSTGLAVANKTHVKKSSTSAIGSTTTVPATTTTTVIKTTNLSAARVHNSYRTTGYFLFPGSWSAYSIKLDGYSYFYARNGQRIGVADLTDEYRGDQPRNAVQFTIWTFPSNESIPTPSSILDATTPTTPWGMATLTRGNRKFTVNGYNAADALFRVRDGNTAIDMREVAVLDNKTRKGCVFFMVDEEKNKSKYSPVFDQILASLNLETNATTPEEATTQSTQSF
jgi:hypothetical protein